VAVRTLVRSVPVNHNQFLADKLGLCMTLRTGDIGVSPRQGEVRMGVVIEGGRRPAL